MSILTLSGWAQPHDALTFLIPGSASYRYAEYKSAEEALLNLRQYTPRIAIGWSLGGLLLVQAVAMQILQPKLLVLLATPYQFVASEDYRHAMVPYTFRTFYQNYETNPTRTASRFNALIAKGDTSAKQVLERLSGNTTAAECEIWLPWLGYLATFSCKMLDFTKFPSTLIVHGKQDAVVSMAQAQTFQEALPSSRIMLWEGCGHAPHLHAPERLFNLIRNEVEAYV